MVQGSIGTHGSDDCANSRPGCTRARMACDGQANAAEVREFQFEGGRLFYRKTLGGENVGRLFVREGWDGREQLLFDPNSYKKGTDTAVRLFVPSLDGKYVVLGLAAKGGEWSELRVLRVDDGQLLPESIYPAGWYGVSWLPGNQAFLYNGGDVTDVKSPDIELNRKDPNSQSGVPDQRRSGHPEQRIDSRTRHCPKRDSRGRRAAISSGSPHRGPLYGSAGVAPLRDVHIRA